MIDDILIFQDRGRQTHLEILTLICETVGYLEMLAERVQGKGIELASVIPPDLPIHCAVIRVGSGRSS